MKAVTKIIFLDNNGEKFFGEGPARLLRGIEETGSLRSSAMSMNMAYTKALKLIKNAEAALGFPLTTRTTGGRSGGGSTLTTEGKAWLARYEAYRDACTDANRRLIRQFFPQIKCSFLKLEKANVDASITELLAMEERGENVDGDYLERLFKRRQLIQQSLMQQSAQAVDMVLTTRLGG